MNALAALDTGNGIAVAGALVALAYAAVQLGDRLWKPRTRTQAEQTAAEQSIECRFEHQRISDGIHGMHEAQRDLLRAHADMLRVLNETHGMTRQQAELAQVRHREVVDALARVEAALRQDMMRVVT